MNRIPWPRLVLLWLAGIDLRVTLLAVPPLIPHIHRDLPLDETAVAALLGLPVLLLAMAATLGSMIISRFDARRAVILGLVLLAASSALRGAGLPLGTQSRGSGDGGLQQRAFDGRVNRRRTDHAVGDAAGRW
jgi:cyanate permease